MTKTIYQQENLRYAGDVNSRLKDMSFICGWAVDIHNPEIPQLIEIYVDKICIGRTLADQYRSDLIHEIGINGFQGFVFPCPPHLCDDKKHELQIKIIDANHYFPESPKKVLLPFPQHVKTKLQEVEQALAESKKGFEEIEKLLQGNIYGHSSQ